MADGEIGETVAGLVRDVDNLKGWQTTQNGALIRLEGKVDKLVNWIMGEMAAIILLLASVWVKR